MLHNWNVSEPVLCSKLNKASQPSLFSFILMKTKTWGYICQEYSAAYLSISSYLQLASNLDRAGMISTTSSINNQNLREVGGKFRLHTSNTKITSSCFSSLHRDMLKARWVCSDHLLLFLLHRCGIRRKSSVGKGYTSCT